MPHVQHLSACAIGNLQLAIGAKQSATSPRFQEQGKADWRHAAVL